MPSPATAHPIAKNAGLGTRLDSWKEIAAYLGKVERTVKRWDADRGLPIHRVPGGGRASVYAYTNELDEWLKSKASSKSDPTHAETEAEQPEAAFTPSAAANASDLTAFLPVKWPVVRSAKKRDLLLATCGILLAAVFALSVSRAVASGRASQALYGLFNSRHVEPEPGTGFVVSDSEVSQARELCLKGRYEWNQRNPDSLNRALDDFTQAIVHDPSYAQAYVGLADTYDLLREYSSMPDSEAYARAMAAARKAVELDDSLAEAHRALAFAEWWGKWDFVDGEKEFRRAIELNPRDPVARKWHANVLAVRGQFDQSLAENRKAQELDPSSHSILADRGLMMFTSGRQREAIALLKEVERSAPEFLSPHSYLMEISLELRDYPAFLEEGERTAELANDPVLKDIIGSVRAEYRHGGERGLLNELYAKQRKYYLAGKLAGTLLAKTCIMMGRRQEALQLLEEAYKHHESSVLACYAQADLLTLKDEPRYRALLRQMNLPLAINPEPPASSTAWNEPPPRDGVVSH